MEVIALQTYTDKYISLYEGEIRDINTELAQRLIDKNIVALHGEEFLPAVSESDEGKVLTVVDGKWDKAEASGGGSEDLIVTCLYTGSESNPYSLSHTHAQIVAALNEGKNVYIEYQSLGSTSITKFYLNMYGRELNGPVPSGSILTTEALIFSSIEYNYMSTELIRIKTLKIGTDNTVTINYDRMVPLVLFATANSDLTSITYYNGAYNAIYAAYSAGMKNIMVQLTVPGATSSSGSSKYFLKLTNYSEHPEYGNAFTFIDFYKTMNDSIKYIQLDYQGSNNTPFISTYEVNIAN